MAARPLFTSCTTRLYLSPWQVELKRCFTFLTPPCSNGTDVISNFPTSQSHVQTFSLSQCRETGQLVAHHGYHFPHVHVLSYCPAANCNYSSHLGSIYWNKRAANHHRVRVDFDYSPAGLCTGENHPNLLHQCLWHHSFAGVLPIGW